MQHISETGSQRKNGSRDLWSELRDLTGPEFSSSLEFYWQVDNFLKSLTNSPITGEKQTEWISSAFGAGGVFFVWLRNSMKDSGRETGEMEEGEQILSREMKTSEQHCQLETKRPIAFCGEIFFPEN